MEVCGRKPRSPLARRGEPRLTTKLRCDRGSHRTRFGPRCASAGRASSKTRQTRMGLSKSLARKVDKQQKWVGGGTHGALPEYGRYNPPLRPLSRKASIQVNATHAGWGVQQQVVTARRCGLESFRRNRKWFSHEQNARPRSLGARRVSPAPASTPVLMNGRPVHLGVRGHLVSPARNSL
jgi:hypothetical protein